jgi:hypothetical protein
VTPAPPASAPQDRTLAVLTLVLTRTAPRSRTGGASRLGLVEASLTGLLVLAEVNSSQAVLATLTYRLASYWAPLCAGPIAYGLFRIRYRSHPSPPQATADPAAGQAGPQT